MDSSMKVVGAFFKSWGALNKPTREVDLNNLEEEINKAEMGNKIELNPEDLFLIIKGINGEKDFTIPVYILQGEMIEVEGKKFRVPSFQGLEKFV